MCISTDKEEERIKKNIYEKAKIWFGDILHTRVKIDTKVSYLTIVENLICANFSL